jgi:hypothetical protein
LFLRGNGGLHKAAIKALQIARFSLWSSEIAGLRTWFGPLGLLLLSKPQQTRQGEKRFWALKRPH